MSLIGSIICLAVGIVVLVAVRHYVTEPVLRTIGLIIGGILVVVGGIFLLLAVLALAGVGGAGAPALK